MAFYTAISNTASAASSTTLLTDGAATKAAVLSAFQAAARDGKPEDLFIFYLGGYAAPSPDGSVKWFLADWPKGFLTVPELNNLLDRIPARYKVVIVDSCGAGAIAGNARPN